MIEAGILNDRRVELIFGEIIQMSPEGPFHHFVNMSVAQYLRLLLGEQAQVSEAHPITLSDSEPEPDIAVVRSPDTLYINRHPYAQDIYWLIEISHSTLSKDLGIKKKAYAQANILEYWIIDIKSQSLKVFQNPQDDNYQIEVNYKDGFISPLAFPTIQINVNKLLGKVSITR
ncbi:hypothetical protein AsFPU1_2306 [Aphanothece sacrum FPU1]|uniref:Putative restriction endonuclease domain-containing protein n=2 Tax=Aphanothece sacrum TaxID=1122 RepID=A0A401IHW9_APHSA|nr:hypothetical protein AsFPU1_2306 [Aphanothece sacrum FPU1]